MAWFGAMFVLFDVFVWFCFGSVLGCSVQGFERAADGRAVGAAARSQALPQRAPGWPVCGTHLHVELQYVRINLIPVLS